MLVKELLLYHGVFIKQVPEQSGEQNVDVLPRDLISSGYLALSHKQIMPKEGMLVHENLAEFIINKVNRVPL